MFHWESTKAPDMNRLSSFYFLDVVLFQVVLHKGQQQQTMSSPLIMIKKYNVLSIHHS
jgi:hypothetical protein